MFNVQGSEIIIIVILALIVIGPEKLPDAIRKFTKFYGEAKKMSTGFQTELRNALDEPMRELQSTVDLVKEGADLRSMATSPIKAKPASATKPAEPATPKPEKPKTATMAEPGQAPPPAPWSAPKAGTAADPDLAPPDLSGGAPASDA